MKNRSEYCATCGAKRPPLRECRAAWYYTAILEMTDHRPVEGAWESRPQLIVKADIWRNGGTDETCHLCDECLRVGLLALKQVIDEALGVEKTDAP